MNTYTTPGEQRAMDILEVEWNRGGYFSTAVDPIVIARNLGVNVYLRRMPSDVSGYIIKREPEISPDIFVNSEHAPVRQRFTVAHELGHYFKRREMESPLGDKYALKRDHLASCGVDSEEIYANQFAAALLMPRAKVRTLVDEGLSAEEIAGLLGVSLDSMSIRLKNLGLSVG